MMERDINPKLYPSLSRCVAVCSPDLLKSPVPVSFNKDTTHSMTNSGERRGPRRKTLASRHAVGHDTRLWESRDLITGREGEKCKKLGSEREEVAHLFINSSPSSSVHV
ncbi:hypothetical protein EYF80_015879 [Liparis tanakae]|uniref:Uncharacterized protein n=1 Tax=Liparis tanakae TaxID=230148 RepID=A0A4Z2I8Z8_9TELE|nr:hypothetical protein EYF80_015879 [Liparis tanakae]